MRICFIESFVRAHFLMCEGKIVEIDKMKVGKQKYNRGKWLDRIWCFGV